MYDIPIKDETITKTEPRIKTKTGYILCKTLQNIIVIKGIYVLGCPLG